MERVYLDHAATAPLRPEVRAAMAEAFLAVGNAASLHAEGRRAAEFLSRARALVASLVGASPADVVFTSGATEASNLAIRGAARARGPGAWAAVTTAVEHAATRRSVEAVAEGGWRAVLADVDPDGIAVPRELPRGTAVVSILAGHNELGTIQDLAGWARAARDAGAVVHFDAVQAAASIDFASLDWDLLSLSAHKLGGPQGVGALVVRPGVTLAPVLCGGKQEGGLRPGTVPAALCVGFGAAAGASLVDRSRASLAQAAQRDRLGDALCALPGVSRLGAWRAHPDRALPHIAAFALRDLAGDEAVAALDSAGVAVSSASACLGDARSPTLRALGLPDSADLLRISLGWSTTEGDVERAIARCASTLADLRAWTPLSRRLLVLEARAAHAGLPLGDDHARAAEAVFTFHRENGVLPGPRNLARRAPGLPPLDRLFPDGLATLAAWLGLPVPPGGCRPAA